MSNFACEHCGTILCDSPRGYTTGCKHYPADVIDTDKQRSVIGSITDRLMMVWNYEDGFLLNREDVLRSCARSITELADEIYGEKK